MVIKTLSIIVPCYNEEATIAKVIEKLLNLQLVGVTKQIIIIDDGSVDGSKNIIDQYYKQYPQLTVCYHPHNQGKGSAIKTGLAKIRGEYTIIQDADLEYNPQEILNLLKKLKMKICWRFMDQET